MSYGSIQMPIVWNGLSMPTEGCSVCIPIVIINFSFIFYNSMRNLHMFPDLVWIGRGSGFLVF